MRRICITISYDGTEYAGWQRQHNALGIQQVLEDTLEALFGRPVHVMASGRTDTGVHAWGQVAAFDLAHEIAPGQLKKAMNSKLPGDIRVMDASEVGPDFHPRFDAKEKTYCYSVYSGDTMPPLYRRYMALETRPLDVGRIREALALMVGRHDFKAFQSTGSTTNPTLRTIYRAELEIDRADSHIFRFYFTGNGFLYNMVRIMAGTLLQVGYGKIPPGQVEQALRAGRRELAGPTAPAHGLALVSVRYL